MPGGSGPSARKRAGCRRGPSRSTPSAPRRTRTSSRSSSSSLRPMRRLRSSSLPCLEVEPPPFGSLHERDRERPLLLAELRHDDLLGRLLFEGHAPVDHRLHPLPRLRGRRRRRPTRGLRSRPSEDLLDLRLVVSAGTSWTAGSAACGVGKGFPVGAVVATATGAGTRALASTSSAVRIRIRRLEYEGPRRRPQRRRAARSESCGTPRARKPDEISHG